MTLPTYPPEHYGQNSGRGDPETIIWNLFGRKNHQIFIIELTEKKSAN